MGTRVPACLSVGLMQRSGMCVHEGMYKHLWTSRWDPHSGSQFLSVLSCQGLTELDNLGVTPGSIPQTSHKTGSPTNGWGPEWSHRIL